MSEITIQGQKIKIEWDQGTARRFRFRMSKHKVKFANGDFTDAVRAQSAFLEFLFLLLPPEIYGQYKDAEDFAASEDWTEEQAIQIGKAMISIMKSMDQSDEKKSSIENTPLPELS